MVLCTGMIVIILLSSCTGKIDIENVPAPVKESFAKSYPDTKGDWEKENNTYEVAFKKNGLEMSVQLDLKGNILETETSIAESELPQIAREYLHRDFPNKKIDETAKIVKADGTIIYEAEVNEKDILFDAEGKFLSIESNEK